MIQSDEYERIKINKKNKQTFILFDRAWFYNIPLSKTIEMGEGRSTCLKHVIRTGLNRRGTDRLAGETVSIRAGMAAAIAIVFNFIITIRLIKNHINQYAYQ